MRCAKDKVIITTVSTYLRRSKGTDVTNAVVLSKQLGHKLVSQRTRDALLGIGGDITIR